MSSFDSRVSALRQALAVNKSFDLLERPVRFGGRRAMFTLIDGFVKDELFEKIMEFFYSLKQDDPCFADEQAFLDLAVPYCEAALEQDESKVVTAVLAGQTALLIEGFAQYVLLDIRTYPQRDTAEPEKDKVFRGSHDGFVETMVLNCALIRRRIRSPHLRMEAFTLGAASQTDVVLCYMADRTDDALLKKLRDRLTRDGQQVDALTMNSESLAELLLPHKWYNPFPRFKYTERPDAAAAQVLEGDVVLLVDNSPAAMTLPTSIFDIMEEANDYYFPPLTGSYLRLTRFLVLLLMLLVTPLWLLVNQNPTWLPAGLAFLIPSEPPAVPLFWQLIIDADDLAFGDRGYRGGRFRGQIGLVFVRSHAVYGLCRVGRVQPALVRAGLCDEIHAHGLADSDRHTQPLGLFARPARHSGHPALVQNLLGAQLPVPLDPL